ncbi:MAG: Ohr family peroxiredoxin [Pseudonocardiaceae bacterium]|nr:Ohr family peroxiredoxin [Pseudonocardiaceae bacterium]
MVEALYTAEAIAAGDGRNGDVHSSDGVIDERLAVPEGMGGPGGSFTNPEQLFAAGYAACFHGALRLVSSQAGVDLGGDSTVTAQVDIGKKSGGGFELGVRISASMPGLEQAKADELVAQAHQVCPYSNATRGNIEIEVSATT